jgi:hypothetical protein
MIQMSAYHLFQQSQYQVRPNLTMDKFAEAPTPAKAKQLCHIQKVRSFNHHFFNRLGFAIIVVVSAFIIALEHALAELVSRS